MTALSPFTLFIVHFIHCLRLTHSCSFLIVVQVGATVIGLFGFGGYTPPKYKYNDCAFCTLSGGSKVRINHALSTSCHPCRLALERHFLIIDPCQCTPLPMHDLTVVLHHLYAYPLCEGAVCEIPMHTRSGPLLPQQCGAHR